MIGLRSCADCAERARRVRAVLAVRTAATHLTDRPDRRDTLARPFVRALRKLIQIELGHKSLSAIELNTADTARKRRSTTRALFVAPELIVVVWTKSVLCSQSVLTPKYLPNLNLSVCVCFYRWGSYFSSRTHMFEHMSAKTIHTLAVSDNSRLQHYTLAIGCGEM